MVRAYIGIGSNLGDPEQQVHDVLPRLDGIRETRLAARSSLYRSEPAGGIEQEDFINAVAAVDTRLAPLDLLLELQAIEQAYYRQREPGLRWGPRTMDLDILLYGQVRQNDSHLQLPHPEIARRLFVLQPLREIAGDLYLPALGSLDYLIANAPPMRIDRLV